MRRYRSFVLVVVLLAVLPAVRAAGTAPPAALGPDRGWVSALALSPVFAHDGRAWAAVYGGKIFASDDGVSTWHAASSGETDPVVTSLAASPGFVGDRTVFAAADDGIFKSIDGGQTWSNSSAGLQGHFARVIALSPDFPQDHLAYAATDGGVYRSNDGGASWQAPETSAVPVSTLAIAAGAPSLLLAGPSAGGLLVSTDQGQTWTPAPGFPTTRQVLAIAGSPASADDGTILVGSDDGLWQTTDRGMTWTQTGLAGDRIASLAYSPDYSQDGIAFAGSSAGNGVFESTDHGTRWQPAGALPFSFVQSLAVSPDFAADHILLAGTAGAGIYVSHDAGASWQPASAGLHAAEVSQLSVDGTRVLMAGTGGASLWSAGAWQDLTLSTRFITAGALAGSALWAGTQNQGLQVSSDGGSSWSQATLPSGAISAIGLAPDFSSSRVALAADGYVYRTSDGGQSWQQASGMAGNDVRRFVFADQFAADHTVFAATVTHRLYRSTDGGVTWVLASTGLPSAQVTDVQVPPTFDADGTAYVSTAGHGIYRSTDGGTSWTSLAAQPPIAVVTALARAPDGSLLAGTEKGIYQFTSGQWESLAGPWDDYVTALATVPAAGGALLYIGTLGDGVWELPLSVPPTPPSATIPTFTPLPLPAPIRPPTPAPSPPPVSRPLHPYLRLYPNPLLAAESALLVLQGPGHGTVVLRLSAHTWRRTFTATLPADGRAAFGFQAPPSTLSIVAVVRGRRQTATVRLMVRVVPP